MRKACSCLFAVLNKGFALYPTLFEPLKLYFIDTIYAPAEQGLPTISLTAVGLGVKNKVVEIPSRIPDFQALRLLQEADLLIVPGSDNAAYTDAKIYPYIG